MDHLAGYQKHYLRGLAHRLKPLVFVGQKGFTRALADAVDQVLDQHELVKVKFNAFKAKEQKAALVDQIEKSVGCQRVGSVGHVAIFYRRQSDPEKRRITLPPR